MLQADSGAHNLCVISDHVTNERLHDIFGPETNDCTCFAVGGQYCLETRPKPGVGYDGVYLFGISHSGTQLRATRCKFLVDGAHEGVIERRAKCMGFGEFDGQSALIYHAGAFVLFTRANACVGGGYRGVQFAQSKTLDRFGRFSLIVFPAVPANANIYFAHPFVVDGELMLIMPISFEEPEVERSGIYVARSVSRDDGALAFHEPRCLIRSATCAGRTVDVNACACHWGEDGQVLVLLHRWVRSRMTKDMATEAPPEALEWWLFEKKEPSTTGAAGPEIQTSSSSGKDAAVVAIAHDGQGVPFDEVRALFVAEALTRRAIKLEEIGGISTIALTNDETQDVWRQWMSDWVATRGPGEPKLKRPRSKFGSYIFKNVGTSGERLLWLVIQTGREVTELRRCIAHDGLHHACELQTKKAAQPTLAQQAAKARRRQAYIVTKAGMFFREQGLCELCGDDNDGRLLRECLGCKRASCDSCMHHNWSHCLKCPAKDDYRGLTHGSRCQKCAWNYQDDDRLRACSECHLALCEWCRRPEDACCRRGCPARFSPSHEQLQPGGGIGHRHGHRYAFKLAEGHQLRRANYLSAQLTTGRPTTAVERILKRLSAEAST